MKRVNSDALQEVDRALGITGQAGALETEFQDGIVDQVLDVGPLIRRGRTLGISEGIFEGTLRNVHPGAGSLTSVTNIYLVPVAPAFPPWPTPVPRGFDVWLLNAVVRQVSGAGTFQGALFANYDAGVQAFGVSNTGATVVSSAHHVLVNWDGLVTDTFVYGVLNGAVPKVTPFRLVRGTVPGTSLTFSSTASDVITFDCQVLIGLFPTGLGQDVIL